MSWVLLVVIILVLAAGLWLIVSYNKLVRLRNESDQAFSSIEMQVKRRADLVPNLVEAVKGYAKHEQGVFEAVTARAATLQARGPVELAAADVMMRARSADSSGSRRRTRSCAGRDFKQLQARALRHRGQDRRDAPVLQLGRPALQHEAQTLPTSLVAGGLGVLSRASSTASRTRPIGSRRRVPA